MKSSIRTCLDQVLFALVVAGAVVQAQKPAPATSGSDFGSKQFTTLLRDPLPAKVVAQAPQKVYNSDSLYQYIDGGADLYLLYEFTALLHQDFKSGASEITADIYDMSKPDDAYGIYASERSPGSKFLSIGTEGYQDLGILNFVQDRYYVKLSGSGADEDSLLDQFARVLSTRIGGMRTLPPLLQRLPHEHRVPHSEQYIRKDPLGHSFLAPAYMVTYTQGKQQSKLIISIANDASGAKARADQLAKHFKQTGDCTPAPELGEGGIRAQNSFEGRMIARTRGRHLIILLNPATDGPELLKTTAQNLP